MVHLQRRKFLVAATGLALGGLFGTARVLASDSALPRPEAIFETVQVADGVYALVGELGQRSPTNLGNNMTCGFIVADDAVVVVDSGGSRAGAQVIHAAVREVTDKPIKWVINSGGQDHRWLGNQYFIEEVGAEVIAADAGKDDMVARTASQVNMAKSNIGENFAGTEPAYPTQTFGNDSTYVLPLDGVRIELIWSGGAHTPADLFVWLPEKKIVFTGDIVFADRLLGIMPDMGMRWINALEYLRDELRPEVVIPGHGAVTDLEGAMQDSYAYLTHLRDGAREAFEAGAFDAFEASQEIDQSPFAYLANYSDARFRSRNALRMAEEVAARMFD